MALESASFIDDLVETNPVGGDPITQGDDHLRLLKAVLKGTFPGLDEALLGADGRIKAAFLPDVESAVNRNGARLASDLLLTTSYVTAFSTTLTPSSSSAKVAIRVSVATNGIQIYRIRVQRGSTIVWESGSLESQEAPGVDAQGEPVTIYALDEPASTSEQTYNVQAISSGDTLTAGSNIVVEEL